MSYLPKVSTLVLDTRDIKGTAGEITSDRTEFIFRNIDLDILLGGDWRVYDLFNIMLVSVIFHKSDDDAPVTTTPEVRMYGLPFFDSDLRAHTKTQEIAVTSVDVSEITTSPQIINYAGANTWTFTRADRGLMNFSFRLVDTAQSMNAIGTFPHQQYVFKLYHV